MTKIKQAQDILKTLGLPLSQQNEMSALTLLALCGLGKNDPWSEAKKASLTVSKGIMNFVKEKYKKTYAPNTRETFRRQVLHQFVQARIADYNPDNLNLPTNSPQAHYALTDDALNVIRQYGTPEWKEVALEFLNKHGSLLEKYMKKREGNLVPVKLSDGTVLHLSPGKHNEVQAGIVQEFAPRFAQGATLLYLGDTAKKNLYLDTKVLTELNIPITDHDKLPDVVLYEPDKKWLYLIEAVTSHGPMTPKRIVELEEMFKNSGCGLVYVTAFPDFTEFRRHIGEIAWDTEVWVLEFPDHMVHYNGDRFMGPR